MHPNLLAPMLSMLLLAGCTGSGETPPTPTPPSADAATNAATDAATTGAATTDSAPRPATPAVSDATAPAAGTSPAPEPSAPAEPAPADDDAQAAPAGTAWHAFGNEPFWSVQARGTTLVFSTPEDQAGTTLHGKRVPSLIGTVILGSGPRGKFHLGVTPGKCSDGMSDRSYAHTATFIYAGTTYKGCAEPAGTGR